MENGQQLDSESHPTAGDLAGAGLTDADLRHLRFAAISLAALALYGVFIACHFASGYGGSDSSGYMNSARLLTHGSWTQPMQLVPELGENAHRYCFPLGFVPQGDSGRMVPTYPVGLPLLLAPSALLGGWHWGPLVLYTAGTLLTVVMCYLSGREIGVGPVWSAVAAAALACSPMFIWSSEQIMSDAPAATWCAVAFYAALRGRRSALAAGCCGLAFVLAVMIRPSDFFLLPALSIVLWNWRKLLSAFVGGLPLAAWYGWYNQTLWNRPWNTGYGSLYTMLEWAHVRPSLAHYAQWLPHLLPIGVLGLAGLCFLPWRSNGRAYLGLLLWFGAMAVLYLFYPYTYHDWWYIRFLLPAFPALAVLGAAALERLAAWGNSHERPWIAAATAGMLLLVSFGMSLRDWEALGVRHLRAHCNTYHELSDWVREHMPEQAIISTLEASGTMVFHGRTIVRWDVIPGDKWESVAAAVRQSGRPLYFIDIDGHTEEAFGSKTPGVWQKIAAVRSFGIWKLSTGDEPPQTGDDEQADPSQPDVIRTARVSAE